ncbi:phage portal protein [Leucobacter triazinivorans]|uniref:Phage portal protein n=1 Tax=Leucobacter triazinivorans TaxID=1784719 RepID=A0A4P6KGW5_9MICO|nr:phage portal protein [Leucobacter triazinivorans]QBE48754.1 phage portal protein [Leucobacter triazinivorans]
MGIMQRTAELIGFAKRSAEDTPSAPPAIMPPPRQHVLNDTTAMLILDVYRAVEVLQIGVSQLGLDQWRGDRRTSPASIIVKPDTETHRPAFLEWSVVSLALDGNAYWRILRGMNREPICLQPLNPAEVSPVRDEKTGRVKFYWRGLELAPGDRTGGDIVHLQKLRKPGREKGLGPIEAARVELTGTMQARDYSSTWFERGDVPSGILTTEQQLNGDVADEYKKRWMGWNPETGKYEPSGHGVRVLGHGLKYDPLQIKPADLQFLETQQFNTTQIARLFGIPASLMLAVIEGNSQSYANVEQDWIAFTRFTLMVYLREIEEALSSVIPHGNHVRFNVDALHRSDTLTRYQAHEVGIRSGFLTVPEAREIEGLDPLTPEQLAALTPTQETTNV